MKNLRPWKFYEFTFESKTGVPVLKLKVFQLRATKNLVCSMIIRLKNMGVRPRVINVKDTAK